MTEGDKKCIITRDGTKMKYEDAVKTLIQWCEESDGKRAIDLGDGESATFKLKRRFTDNDIETIERNLSWSVPGDYRYFLRHLGECSLFLSKYGVGSEFFSPEQIVTVHRELRDMDEEEPIVDQFCMAGIYSCLGDFFGFITNRSGNRVFDVFCHEYPVFEYANISDELKTWQSFEEWILKLVQSKGDALD